MANAETTALRGWDSYRVSLANERRGEHIIALAKERAVDGIHPG